LHPAAGVARRLTLQPAPSVENRSHLRLAREVGEAVEPKARRVRGPPVGAGRASSVAAVADGGARGLGGALVLVQLVLDLADADVQDLGGAAGGAAGGLQGADDGVALDLVHGGARDLDA